MARSTAMLVFLTITRRFPPAAKTSGAPIPSAFESSSTFVGGSSLLQTGPSRSRRLNDKGSVRFASRITKGKTSATASNQKKKPLQPGWLHVLVTESCQPPTRTCVSSIDLLQPANLVRLMSAGFVPHTGPFGPLGGRTRKNLSSMGGY